jgi:Ca2+-binding RTX toxin-like protein
MNIETMEGRTLFSVTVSQGDPGYYAVVGTEGADDVAISVDMDNETFTLNGETYAGVATISVNTAGGDDVVSLLAWSVGYIGANVDTGDGDDIVTLNFDGAITAGGGNDHVDISDSFQGSVEGGDGADSIVVSGGSVDAVISGGDGDDLIDASGNHFSAWLYGGGGDDVIYGSDYADRIYGGAGADALYGGGGNDWIYAGGDGVEDTIDGGSGYDTLVADAVEGEITSVESYV